MKFENFDKARRIVQRIKDNEKALNQLKNLPFVKNSDGSGSSAHNELHELHLCQYSDASGFKVTLTGSMIQVEILEFAKEKLRERIACDYKSLDDL